MNDQNLNQNLSDADDSDGNGPGLTRGDAAPIESTSDLDAFKDRLRERLLEAPDDLDPHFRDNAIERAMAALDQPAASDQPAQQPDRTATTEFRGVADTEHPAGSATGSEHSTNPHSAGSARRKRHTRINARQLATAAALATVVIIVAFVGILNTGGHDTALNASNANDQTDSAEKNAIQSSDTRLEHSIDDGAMREEATESPSATANAAGEPTFVGSVASSKDLLALSSENSKDLSGPGGGPSRPPSESSGTSPVDTPSGGDSPPVDTAAAVASCSLSLRERGFNTLHWGYIAGRAAVVAQTSNRSVTVFDVSPCTPWDGP